MDGNQGLPGACGFLDESPGVRSSTRLIAVILLALVAVIIGLIVWYVVRRTSCAPSVDPNPAVLATLAGVAATLGAQLLAAIFKRGDGDGPHP